MQDEMVDRLESDCDRPFNSNPMESQARCDHLAGLAMRMRRCNVPIMCFLSMISLDITYIPPLYVINCSEQLIIPSAIKTDTGSAHSSLYFLAGLYHTHGIADLCLRHIAFAFE